jgi:membrane fusion protein (multidrug efflux system)
MGATRKAVVVAAAVFALAVLAAAGAAIYEKKFKKKDDKPPATLEFSAREVESPRRETLPLLLQFSGPLVAPRTAVVRAKESGTLLSLAVGEGQRVKAGTTLGQIDLTSMTSRLAERNAMLESAQAQLAQAERTHASNQRLAQQEFISSNALETSRVALEAARAQVKAAQAQLQTTRAGWNEALLVAPIGGLVAKRHVVAGEKVAPEQAVLTIVDLAKLELAGSVGTHEVARLSTGMPAQLRIEGVDGTVVGTIDRISPAAEAGTRSIGVIVVVDNAGERLRAGQYAVASVELADDMQRLTVPLAAVASNAGQDYVWVIDDGVLVRRAVTLGRRDAVKGRVEVLQGLDAKAAVLAVRFDNLKEGAKALVLGGPMKPAQLAIDGAQPIRR